MQFAFAMWGTWVVCVMYVNHTQSSIRKCLNVIRTGDSDERSKAADVLVAAGAKAVPAIIGLLKEFSGLCWEFVAFCKSDQETRNAVICLIHALHSDENNRFWAVTACAKLSDLSREALTSLVKMLDEQRANDLVRFWTRVAMREMQEGDTSSGSARLVTKLKSGVEEEQLTVLNVLDRIGGVAFAALVESFDWHKSDCPVRDAVARSLGMLGNSAVKTLVVLLEEESHDIQVLAANALAQIGRDAVEAGPQLCEQLKSADAAVRCAVARALGLIGVGSDEVVHSLAEAVFDQCDDVRLQGIMALEQIGSPAKEVLPTIVEALKDSNVKVRDAAGSAWCKLDDAATFLLGSN